MTATYDCIATTTVTGTATSSITFSNISGSYTDLVLVLNGGTSGAANVHLRFNGDTGSNYITTGLSGGGSLSSSRSSAGSSAITNDYGYGENDMNLNIIIDIMNYSSTATRKTFLSRSNHADNGTAIISGMWRDTSAITSIEILSLFTGSPTFSIGTTFSLYGIKCE
jgi:hypothetical protein